MNTPRIPAIDPANASGKTAELFSVVKAKMGVIPNLVRTFAQSDAALSGYVGLNAALSSGILPAKIREQLALTISEINGCDYCLSAHSLVGKLNGLSPEAIENARRGQSDDAKTNAILQFARALITTHGKVSNDAVAATRAAGVTDAELVEIVGAVAINVLTNYTNNLAQTQIDFPLAKPLQAAA